MELSILHAIQSLHNPILDQIMIVVFNNLVGSLGQLWIVVGLVLLIIPKTRKCGVAVLLSYLVSFLIGNEWLKDLIARPRPCAVDDTAIYHYYKKPGIGVLIFAALVGFSRMYFFVHYPTDVLFGAVLGILTAFVVCVVLDKIFSLVKKK